MDLTDDEFEFIEEYCLPESTGKISVKLRSKKICGLSQLHLKKCLAEGIITLEREEIVSIPIHSTSFDAPAPVDLVDVPIAVKQLKVSLKIVDNFIF